MSEALEPLRGRNKLPAIPSPMLLAKPDDCEAGCEVGCEARVEGALGVDGVAAVAGGGVLGGRSGWITKSTSTRHTKSDGAAATATLRSRLKGKRPALGRR